MHTLVQVIGWVLTIFFTGLAAVILWLIATGKIDLKLLISEKDGTASLSRFQFLVFTFVIAMSLFYLIASTGSYPPIPGEILALLGISGGSYVVAKGIQTSHDVGMVEARTPDAVVVTPAPPTPPPPPPAKP